MPGAELTVAGNDPLKLLALGRAGERGFVAGREVAINHAELIGVSDGNSHKSKFYNSFGRPLTMEKAVKAAILDILSTQTDMTIATLREDQYPQATTVSYVNEGLDIYFGCSTRSQKAQNIARHNKISLTVTPPYTDWNSIRGLSIGGLAERITAPSQVTLVEALFFRKFPFVVQYAPDNREDLAFFKVVPRVFSVLDYTKGFGHTDLVAMAVASSS